jgi:hypothetical protein
MQKGLNIIRNDGVGGSNPSCGTKYLARKEALSTSGKVRNPSQHDKKRLERLGEPFAGVERPRTVGMAISGCQRCSTGLR